MPDDVAKGQSPHGEKEAAEGVGDPAPNQEPKASWTKPAIQLAAGQDDHPAHGDIKDGV